jgi:Histidine kinase-, DNA gyrase B-, and HSP90-like ATPase
MKPLASNVLNSGNLAGESAAMGINAENFEHLMSVLTNLYSDPITAVIREYSTNAFDAHVEAGLTAPIKVTLPTKLNPTLSIEDFGVGMTTDELLSLYSQYGSSTKRGTNEQTGMLGLGSKSALAVTSQFTVRSRKGGVETKALIFLNDRGAGEIKITDTRATDETGTLVQIPVEGRQIREAVEAAARFFSVWPAGSVVGVGTPATGKVISDTVTLKQRGMFTGGQWNGGRLVLVQGNVPYVVDSDKITSDHITEMIESLPLHLHDVVIRVPIGSVQFTPSREALYYTNLTIRYIEQAVNDYRAAIKAWIETSLAKCQTKTAALEFAESNSAYAEGVTLTYRGEIVPTPVKVSGFTATNATRSNPSSWNSLPTLANVKAAKYVVYGVPASATDKQAYVARQRISRHANVDGLVSSWSSTAIRGIFIVGDLPENWDWYGVEAIHWTSFGVGPKVAGTGSKAQAHKDYLDREWRDAAGQYYRSTTKIKDPKGNNVVFLNRDESVSNVPTDCEYQFVYVPLNQLERFQRELPKAIGYWTFRKQVQDKLEAAITPAVAAYLGSTRYLQSGPKLLDPDAQAVVDLVKQGEKEWAKLLPLRNLAASVRVRHNVPESKASAEFVKRYLAIVSRFSGDNSTLTEILNAMYLYKFQKGSK